MLRELLGDITRQNHMSAAACPVLAIQGRHRGGPRAHVPVFKGVVVVFVGVMDLTGWHLIMHTLRRRVAMMQRMVF
jgi:hypothetical protein